MKAIAMVLHAIVPGNIITPGTEGTKLKGIQGAARGVNRLAKEPLESGVAVDGTRHVACQLDVLRLPSATRSSFILANSTWPDS